MTGREQRAARWLAARGCGLFSYREVAEGTGMTRDQALIACLALADRGVIGYRQWIDHYGTHTYELTSAPEVA